MHYFEFQFPSLSFYFRKGSSRCAILCTNCHTIPCTIFCTRWLSINYFSTVFSWCVLTRSWNWCPMEDWNPKPFVCKSYGNSYGESDMCRRPLAGSQTQTSGCIYQIHYPWRAPDYECNFTFSIPTVKASVRIDRNQRLRGQRNLLVARWPAT
jgi:hypothetical protein